MYKNPLLKIVLSLLAVVLLLPGGLSRPTRAADPVELTWAVEWTDDSTVNRFTQNVVEPFQKANPNITIKIVQHAGADALDRDLKAELAAGAGPDIFDTNGPTWVPPYVDA